MGPSRATFVGLAAVLHRRTGLTGYPDRSDRSEHRRCNCAVAHRVIKRIRVLALDWREHILATPLGTKDLGYLNRSNLLHILPW